MPVIHQYYHHIDRCPAEGPSSPNCVCWHSEGEGPEPRARPDGHELRLWRTVDTCALTAEQKIELALAKRELREKVEGADQTCTLTKMRAYGEFADRLLRVGITAEVARDANIKV